MIPIFSLILAATSALVIWRHMQRQRKKDMRRNRERWSIGIFEGHDPVTLMPPQEIINPILKPEDVTDVEARFIADPFLIKHNREYWLFFEVMNSSRNKGEIGCARSRDMKTWNYHGIALRERFHLSYPCVFEFEGSIYMVPESAKSNAVRLYKATAFPGEWQYETSLIRGNRHSTPLLDPSIFLHEGNWYLFTHARKTRSLHLFTSPSLTGEWKEHPKSPVVKGCPHFSRPGGRVVYDAPCLYRFAQDSIPRYGSKAWGFRITELTPATYHEEQLPGGPVVKAGKEPWNNAGMHTVDPHRMENGRWIAAVDGMENISKRQKKPAA